MKRFRKWIGVETTLRSGENTYHGRLDYDYLNCNGPESKKYKERYVFKTTDGKRIPVNPRRLRVQEGGLVLKIDK